MTPLESVLYEFVRCELAHEGSVASDVVFTPSPPGDMTLFVDVRPNRLTVSESLLDGLINTIVAAPENAAVSGRNAAVAAAANAATPPTSNSQS